MTRVKGHELDLRVSTIPTVHGESIVMRVLDRDSIKLSLSVMGFSDDTLQRYQAAITDEEASNASQYPIQLLPSDRKKLNPYLFGSKKNG